MRGAVSEVPNVAPDHHISPMNLDLTEHEGAALIRLLRDAIDGDRYPLSPRVQVLRAILARLKPEPARPAASQEPRIYAPPSRGR